MHLLTAFCVECFSVEMSWSQKGLITGGNRAVRCTSRKCNFLLVCIFATFLPRRVYFCNLIALLPTRVQDGKAGSLAVIRCHPTYRRASLGIYIAKIAAAAVDRLSHMYTRLLFFFFFFGGIYMRLRWFPCFANLSFPCKKLSANWWEILFCLSCQESSCHLTVQIFVLPKGQGNQVVAVSPDCNIGDRPEPVAASFHTCPRTHVGTSVSTLYWRCWRPDASVYMVRASLKRTLKPPTSVRMQFAI